MDDAAEIARLVAELRRRIGDPRRGLPDEVFLLVSQLTPLLNVDLLIRNDRGQTLLTWRADEYYGPGWHVPGGIVRFKEAFSERIAAVAETELGCSVTHEPSPIRLREITSAQRDVRGHFVSLLYPCTLRSPPAAAREARGSAPQPGQWSWHDASPRDLIPAHEAYRADIDSHSERARPWRVDDQPAPILDPGPRRETS